MHVATALFTYNRKRHTKEVLDSLKKNTVLPEKLFLFHDGLKEGEDEEEWNKVQTLLDEIDWCEKEVIVSRSNKGLAKSIVSGINYAFESFDAIIVLEDDCVTAPLFMEFMTACLRKYETFDNVYNVSGYDFLKGKYKSEESSIYFCGRTSSFGWGTWKDRWIHFDEDYTIVKQLKSSAHFSKALNTWGADLEDMLVGNVRGSNDSWSVFWSLNVIERGGVCINSREPLIHNIGFDGTGVHSGVSNEYDVVLEEKRDAKFTLPDHITYERDIEYAFASRMGRITAINEIDDEKEEVVVYGTGAFFANYEKELNKAYYVKTVIDNNKNGFFAGKKIYKEENYLSSDNKIILMLMDLQECFRIARRLIQDKKIDYRRIILGRALFGEEDLLRGAVFTQDGKLRIKTGRFSVIVRSLDEFNNLREVVVDETYRFDFDNEKTDVVVDVGMNTGDSVLYFLSRTNTEEVYGYEPFPDTFSSACENISQNAVDQSRVHIFRFGLSDVNEERTVLFNGDMTCGQSSDKLFQNKAYESYKNMGLVNLENDKIEKIEVRDASEVLKEIIDSHKNNNIVLKIDCEGEEYRILPRLAMCNLLEHISLIMMEWHHRGSDIFVHILRERGFLLLQQEKNAEMGLIYAWNKKLLASK